MVIGCPGVIGGGGYIPQSISGLRLWLDSRRITGLADGAKVATWSDLSGNRLDFIQGTDANRPVYRSGLITVSTAVQFTAASSQFLSNAAYPTSDTAATCFIVMSMPADPPASDQGLWKFSSAAVGVLIPRTTGLIYDSFGSSSRYATVNPTDPFTSPVIYSIVSQSGSWVQKVNDATIYTSGTNTVGWSSTPFLGKSVETTYFTGYVYELLIYNSVISASNNSKIVNYLSNKWGISIVQQ